MYVYVVVTLKRGVVDYVKAFGDQAAADKFFGDVRFTLSLDSVYGVSMHRVLVC